MEFFEHKASGLTDQDLLNRECQVYCEVGFIHKNHVLIFDTIAYRKLDRP